MDLTIPSRSTPVVEKDNQGNDLPMLDKRYYYLLLAIVQRLGGVSGGVAITTALIDSTVATDGKILIGNTASGRYEQSTYAIPTSITQGDLWYATGAGTVVPLAKDANATRYLSNQGSSNGPSWNQVNLTNGVTGALPIANGGTGQTSQTSAFDALAPTTTKGDLIAYDGSDNIRLAVGTNGYVLTANSSQTTGMHWAPAATGSGVEDGLAFTYFMAGF